MFTVGLGVDGGKPKVTSHQLAWAVIWCCFSLSYTFLVFVMWNAPGWRHHFLSIFTFISMMYQYKNSETLRLYRGRCCNSLKRLNFLEKTLEKNLFAIPSTPISALIRMLSLCSESKCSGEDYSCDGTMVMSLFVCETANVSIRPLDEKTLWWVSFSNYFHI